MVICLSLDRGDRRRKRKLLAENLTPTGKWSLCGIIYIFESCVLKTSTVRVSIDTITQHSIDTLVNGHLNRYLADTRSMSQSTLDWQLANSWLSVIRFMHVCIVWHSMVYEKYLQKLLGSTNIKCWSSAGATKESIKYRSSIDQGYQ